MNHPKALILFDSFPAADSIKSSLQEKGIVPEVRSVQEWLSAINKAHPEYFDYFFVILLDFLNKKSRKFLKLFAKGDIRKSFKGGLNSKTVFILPHFQTKKKPRNLNDLINNLLLPENTGVALVFVGELYKGNNLLTNYGMIFDILKEVGGKKIFIPKEEEYFVPLSVEEFSDRVVKRVFSLSRKRVSVFLSNKISPLKFITLLEKSGFEKVEFVKRASEDFLKTNEGFDYTFINTDINKVASLIKAERQKGSRNFLRVFFKKFFLSDRRGYLKYALFVPFFLLPFFLNFLNNFVFNTSEYLEKYGFWNLSWQIKKVNKQLLSASEKYNNLFSTNLSVSYPYNCLKKVFKTNSLVLDISLSKSKVKRDFLSIFDVKKGGEAKESLIRRIPLDIEEIMRKGDFYRSEQEKSFCRGLPVLKPPQAVFNDEELSNLKRLSEDLGYLLGINGKRTYAILIQDNTSPRPGGGLIKQVVLVEISRGVVEKTDVFSVPEIDKGFKGIIDPPSTLKEFLGVERFFLRDSNWYSDFSMNSKQVLFFLNQALDAKIDGVFALNIDVLERISRSLLRKEEPEYVSRLRELNLFTEKYPLDAEEFTADPNVILEGIQNLSPRKKSKILEDLFLGLKEKSIQVFINDENINKNLVALGWGGGINSAGCFLENCYSDYVAVIEVIPEVGSPDIEREVLLKVSIEEGLVRRELLYKLKPAGPSGKIPKVYLRLVVPQDSGVGMVGVVGRNFKTQIRPEVVGILGRKEINVFIYPQNLDELAYRFFWESSTPLSFKDKGEYSLSFFKQPGVRALPLKVSVGLDTRGLNFDYENIGLTGVSTFGYNTSLAKDIRSRILWKNGNYTQGE